MKKASKITLMFILLNNLSSAGTITNATIDNSNNSKGINYKTKGGDKIFNNNGTTKNITIINNNNLKGINYKNNEGNKTYLKDGYIDTKKCYKELGIPYNENKIQITLIDNETIKINNKTIKADKCLVKNK